MAPCRAGRKIRQRPLRRNAENQRDFADELCAEIRNRMPVILKPEAWQLWLGEEPADETRLKSLLAPTLPTSDGMLCWPVSTRVGNVKNTTRR